MELVRGSQFNYIKSQIKNAKIIFKKKSAGLPYYIKSKPYKSENLQGFDFYFKLRFSI